MGSALCRKLTESGDRVWGLDLAFPAEACSWRCLRADITSAEDVEAALNAVRQEAGALDGIVHMAGSMTWTPWRRWKRTASSGIST